MTGTTGSGETGAAGDVQWYIARDGQQHGPLSDAEIRLFVEGGHLRPTDLLWRPSFADWRPALQVFPPRAAAEPPLPAPTPTPQAVQPEVRPAAQPAAQTPSAAEPQQTQPRQPQPQSSPSPQPQSASTPAPAATAPTTASPGASAAMPQPGPAAGAMAARQPYGQQQPQPAPSMAPRAQMQAAPAASAQHAPRPGEATGRPAASAPSSTAVGPATGGRPATNGPRPNGNTTAGRSAAAPVPATEEPASRFGIKTMLLGALLIGVIGLSVWYIAYNKSDLMRMAGIGDKQADGKVPVVKADQAVKAALQKPTSPASVPATKPATAPAAAPVAPAAAPLAAAPVAPAAAVAEPPLDTAIIDGVLQKRPLWTLMKERFPEWYAERTKQAARLAVEKKPDRDVTKHLVEALVAHRRKNSDLALKASTGRHKAIATAFLDNLQALSGRSADTCYRFISQGETSPIVVDLINDISTAGPIEAQAIAIFEAVSEGKAQPVAHERPKKEDYDVLAAQLGKLGWSQADLQMFADPKALSAAAPARVCQMVRDWFKAHVDITDGAVQERLLFETLRPVVAG